MRNAGCDEGHDRSSSRRDSTRRVVGCAPMMAQRVLVFAIPLPTLAPPAKGAILIVTAHSPPGKILAWALPTGARLLGAGPFPGSIKVFGDRAALVRPALAHGALLLEAQRSGCIVNEESMQ